MKDMARNMIFLILSADTFLLKSLLGNIFNSISACLINICKLAVTFFPYYRCPFQFFCLSRKASQKCLSTQKNRTLRPVLIIILIYPMSSLLGFRLFYAHNTLNFYFPLLFSNLQTLQKTQISISHYSSCFD